MKRLTKDEFITKARAVHGDKFSYELVNYMGGRIKVKIICFEHGIFRQLPKNHLHLKQGCPSCYGNKKLSTNDFIEKSNIVHENRYDYSKTIYTGNKGKVEITCSIHGSFIQTATRHLSGDGCPKCSESKGERSIRKYLIDNLIKFESQKKFENCRNVNVLPFDFYIPDKNLLIEFDGQQHFGKSKGMSFDFESIKKNDKIKTEFAKNNGIKLIRIPYTKLNKINEELKIII